MWGRVRRLIAIIQKETIQTLRDWLLLAMILGMPILELYLFASVGDMTVEDIPTAVADMSMDAYSRDFLDALETSGSFEVQLYLESEQEVIQAIEEGRVGVGVVIPPDLATQVERGEAQALVLLDGSDSYIVQSGFSAAAAIAQDHSMELVMQRAEQAGMGGLGNLPIYTAARILYNPNMDEMLFLIPGIAAALLQLLTVNITAMSVVRERELGMNEQLLVTPIRPFEIMLGKMAPAIVLTAVDLAIVIVLGVYWFKVPFQGSVGLFAWLSLVFLVSGLGLGLMISTIAKNQKQVQQINALLMMLTMMLTGLLYPRSTMSPVVRAIGNLIPATYFIRIAKGIISKGVGLEFVWNDVLVLALYGLVVMLIAAATLKKRLD
jgi:ABC-2 type transport system permease protein